MLAFSAISSDDSWPDDDLDLLADLPTAPIVAVLETMPLADLAALLVDRRVPALVVVDEHRLLRGLVTRTDVIVALSAPRRAALAADVMSTLVFTLQADSTIQSAAALMSYERVGQIVVVGRAGELVSLVSSLDIAHHVARRAGYLREID